MILKNEKEDVNHAQPHLNTFQRLNAMVKTIRMQNMSHEVVSKTRNILLVFVYSKRCF